MSGSRMVCYQAIAVFLIVILSVTPPVMQSMQKTNQVVSTGLALIQRNSSIFYNNQLLKQADSAIDKVDFIGISQYIAHSTQPMVKTDNLCIEEKMASVGSALYWVKGGSVIVLSLIWLYCGSTKQYGCIFTTGALGCTIFLAGGLIYLGLAVLYSSAWQEMNELECQELVPWIESTITKETQAEVYGIYPKQFVIPAQMQIAYNASLTTVLPQVFQDFSRNATVATIDTCSFFSTVTKSIANASSHQIAQEWATSYKATEVTQGFQAVAANFYHFAFSKSTTSLDVFCEDLNLELSNFFGFIAVTLAALTLISFSISCCCICAIQDARRSSHTNSREMLSFVGSTALAKKEEQERLMSDEANFRTKPYPGNAEIGSNVPPPPKEDSCFMKCSRWTSCQRKGR